MSRGLRWLIYAAGAAAGVVVIVAVTTAWLWRDRPALGDLPIPIAETPSDSGESTVTVTWLGITTLLFDDGETQILVDGTFTRPSVFDIVFLRKLRSDIATINYVLDEFRIDRIAAIVPVHSHIDHAIDAGNVANRTTAVILGSESIANIARGADVPVDQYQILASGETRHFGEFTITVIESAHAPTGPAEAGWFPGVIEEPLEQPARIWSWRGGAALTVLIGHPDGTTLIQGSGGFIEGRLAGVQADVAMLSVAGLASLGRAYTERYWAETITATGARRVFAIHFDDFTAPFGELRLAPAIVDQVIESAHWIRALAEQEGIPARRLPFGIPVVLYPTADTTRSGAAP